MRRPCVPRRSNAGRIAAAACASLSLAVLCLTGAHPGVAASAPAATTARASSAPGETAPAGAAATPGSVRLRYGFKPGASYEQTATVSVAVQVEMEGLPEESAAMAQAMLKNMQQDVMIKMIMDAGRREPDGALPFTTRIADAKMTATMAGQPIEVPGVVEKMKGLTVRGRITSEGQLAGIDVQGDQVEGVPGNLKESMGQAMPLLPDRALKVGDSFEVPFELALPGLPLGGVARVESKAIYTLKSHDGTRAHFDVRQTISAGAGEGGGAATTLTMSGGAEGVAVFDLDEGFFSSVRMESRVEMTMQVALPGDDPSGQAAAGGAAEGADAGAPAKPILMKATMRGPSEVTTVRRPASP